MPNEKCFAIKVNCEKQKKRKNFCFAVLHIRKLKDI